MYVCICIVYVCAYAYMHVPKARRRRVSDRPRGSCAQAELQLGVVSSVRQSEEECPHAAAARDGSGTAEARAVARRV